MAKRVAEELKNKNSSKDSDSDSTCGFPDDVIYGSSNRTGSSNKISKDGSTKTSSKSTLNMGMYEGLD